MDEKNSVLQSFRVHCRKALPESQELRPITERDIKQALEGKRNYSAPGPDAINSYWWKKLPSTHVHLAKIFNNYLEDNESIPSWLCAGRTTLIFKKGDPVRPENYRPITCLNTIYKVFTSILQERILEQINPVWRGVFEQRGAKRGVAGVRENILIDSCLTKDATTYKRNLSMCWIDYKKAFDCTSHKLITTLLQYMKVHNSIIRSIQHLLLNWKTVVIIKTEKGEIRTPEISYHRGVFQGDSLSPLLFCITLLPISLELRKYQGYVAGPPRNRSHKITHLLYLDDLKVYAQNAPELEKMIKVVHEYSKAVGMEFGESKCATLHIKRGKCLGEENPLELVDGSIIKHLGANESYTYLGIAQKGMNNIAGVKKNLVQSYKNVLRKIWNSELTAKNKCKATNILATPKISYSFGAFKWNVDELRQIDRDTRKIMTLARSLHPNASVQRLYLTREKGGRGLINVELLHHRLVITSACAIINSTDPLLAFVKEHELQDKATFLFKAAERGATVLNIQINVRHCSNLPTDATVMAPTQLRKSLRTSAETCLEEEHRKKPMHGQYYRNMQKLNLSAKLTFAFLRSSSLYSEIEGTVTACQDGVFNTLMYRRTVLGVDINTQCRACKSAPETLMHLLAACPKYAPNLYIKRHNMALKVIYYHIRNVYGIDHQFVQPYEKEEPEPVVSNGRCKILWNFAFNTTAQINANKPDMALLDYETKDMYIIEMTCPAETNIRNKEEDKIKKYKDLLVQLRKTYNEYTIHFVPLVIGVLGGMQTSITKYLKIIKLIDTKSASKLAFLMQKYVLLGSMHLLRAHEAGHPTSKS